MKKYLIFLIACLVCILAACGQNGLATPSSASASEHLSTMVAQTLTAFATEPRLPLATPAQMSTTIQAAPSSTPAFSLDDFQARQLVGENDNYSIYLINPSGGTQAAPTGELLVFNKSTRQVIKMSGSFAVILDGGTLVYDDGKGKYVLLSIGTYTSRKGVVLSVDTQKQAAHDLCMSSGPNVDHLFWNDTLLINNCDKFANRPWGIGEAPGVTAIDLKTGTETVIAKSDLKNQYTVKQIEGNTLQYNQTYVINEADWQNPDQQKTEAKTYDLTLLGSH